MQRIESGEPSANLGVNFVVTMSLSSSIMSTKLGISFKKACSQILHLYSTIFIMQKTLCFDIFLNGYKQVQKQQPVCINLTEIFRQS